MFVSSRRVYFDMSRVPMTVDAPTFTVMNTAMSSPTVLLRLMVPGSLPYPLNKALSEKEALKYFPNRTTIVRPAGIVGPGTKHLFNYWPIRIQRGGRVLAPGDGTDFVQFIDVRDLCEWMIRLAEQETYGIFTAQGPQKPPSFAMFLDGIKAVIPSDAAFTWVDADFLEANGVRPAKDMPLWEPVRKGMEGAMRFDLRREIASGLTFRPLAVTARDSLNYYHAQSGERQKELRMHFFSGARETEVLAAWQARGK
jgi:2'-hydroxyisoflavone reductase